MKKKTSAEHRKTTTNDKALDWLGLRLEGDYDDSVSTTMTNDGV